VGSIIEKTTGENFKLKSLMREIILSESFLGGD
jgi:hypothetical protein